MGEPTGGLALVAPDHDHWAETDLWAPEVMYADGTFYMYVTGTRHAEGGIGTHPGAGVGVNHGNDALRRQGVARSESPTGPFVLDEEPLLGVWSIDGHPFVDLDGRRWLFYNVRDDSTWYRSEVPGCGNVVDELVAPATVTGLATPVTVPSLAWEGNVDRSWFWNEGPTVLRRRGRYVQMYSGGYYGDSTYGVGFATADSPRGPWTKADHNPVFRSHARITGPGHHSVVPGPDGVTLYAVYHGYVDGWPGRKVHVDRLHWSTEGPRMGSGTLPGLPTEDAQPVPEAGGFDPSVPYWHAELWVRGTAVRFGPTAVDLAAEVPVLLDVTQREGTVRVLLDGRLVADGEASGDPAALAGDLRSGAAVDGEVLSLALTTWREDEQIRILEAGEVLVVPWGGELPAELSVAVQGTATVRAVGLDALAQDVEAPGLPHLVRLRATAPVQQVEITAGPAGAVVSDVVLTARPAPGELAPELPEQQIPEQVPAPHIPEQQIPEQRPPED